MTTPSTNLERDIALLIAEVKIKTGWTQEEISRRLGYGDRYISVQKSKKLLRQMPVNSLRTLASMAGKRLTIV